MYSFKELQKASKHKIEGKEIRLAILGNCSTQFFTVAVQGYAKLSGLNVNTFEADYNQIDAQLVDETSEVYSFCPDNILLWLATDKVYEDFLDLEFSQRDKFAELYLQRIEYYWELIGQKSHAKIIQFNFTEINDNGLGQYSCKVDTSFIFQLRKLNYLLQESMMRHNNVYPIDLLAMQMELGREKLYNPTFYYSAKMTIAIDYLPYIAKSVVNVLSTMIGRIKKCIILDLDNTLWGGTIGDDGMRNIEIGELGKGHVFVNFQKWIKQLKDYGIILAVCSKNEEDIAKEPFEKHAEMILRLSDISLFVANWNDKASNIRMIQESLNIGMDSIVFLDDNPYERNLVREKIPEIEVPELPKDPAFWLEYLQRCDYFGVASYVKGNIDRTKKYQEEFERRQFGLTFASIDDYLENLEMIGEAKPFEPFQFSRIAQLTQRSNQFNLRTIRYTEDEIQRVAESKDYLTLYYTLKDKFGDHGLVAIVILEKKSPEELFVNSWLMSCRVLKRSMEEYIVNCMIRTAKENGYKMITAEYIPTAKNKMVKDVYKLMGFTEIGEGCYCVKIKDYKDKVTFVKEELQHGKR